MYKIKTSKLSELKTNSKKSHDIDSIEMESYLNQSQRNWLIQTQPDRLALSIKAIHVQEEDNSFVSRRRRARHQIVVVVYTT